MGIYLPDMKMPERCDECQLRHMGMARCQVTGRSTSHYPNGKPMNEKKRPDWCPLLEVRGLVPRLYAEKEALRERVDELLLENARLREIDPE